MARERIPDHDGARRGTCDRFRKPGKRTLKDLLGKSARFSHHLAVFGQLCFVAAHAFQLWPDAIDRVRMLVIGQQPMIGLIKIGPRIRMAGDGCCQSGELFGGRNELSCAAGLGE